MVFPLVIFVFLKKKAAEIASAAFL